VIELPKRSVTRFFIPLIDVLTLLFCIYLILPIIKTPSEDGDSADAALSGKQTRALTTAERRELERLRQEIRAAGQPADLMEAERREIERLRKEKIETLQQRLAIRVLEIDADTGKLYSYGPKAVEIKSEAEARALIEAHRRGAGEREVYYLFLFPRRVTGFPQKKQVTQYLHWFGDVAHGIDNPHAFR
jgi:hypothetical protein